MLLKTEPFRIELLASKTTLGVLRLFIEQPQLSHSLSDISRITGISKSNVSRALHSLMSAGLLKKPSGGKRKWFQIDSGKRATVAVFELFNEERISNLRPATKNAVEFLLSQIGSQCDAFVLFGSSAYGLETSKSDIDILIIGSKKLEINPIDFLPYRFEIHSKTWEEVEKLVDFVSLDAALTGIVFKGARQLFTVKASMIRFPKNYVLFRLKKIKEYKNKLTYADGGAKRYYKELLRISLGELESLLYNGRIVPKKKAKPKRAMDNIEAKLSGEGEFIWLNGT